MVDVKQAIMNDIEKRSDVFIKSSPIQFRIRCPICGDSQKNPRDAHCYIKCSEDPTEPLLYYCFKCNSHGRVTPSFLEKIGVKKDLISMIGEQKYNKIGTLKKTNVDIITGTPILQSMQVDYIESRLGKGFTVDDYDRFKIVWDLGNVRQHVSERVAHSLPNNNHSISFLSDDKSTLITRTFTNDEPTWNKLRLFRSENKSFYTIRTMLDLFTQEPIVVNIAEGVFDVLSVYRNFNDGPNSIFIATLGSDYISGVDHAVSKGFIGQNVELKIYVDWEIDMPGLKRRLRSYKWLFNKITIYSNVLYKDVGTSTDKIRLAEVKI